MENRPRLIDVINTERGSADFGTSMMLFTIGLGVLGSFLMLRSINDKIGDLNNSLNSPTPTPSPSVSIDSFENTFSSPNSVTPLEQ